MLEMQLFLGKSSHFQFQGGCVSVELLNVAGELSQHLSTDMQDLTQLGSVYHRFLQ